MNHKNKHMVELMNGNLQFIGGIYDKNTEIEWRHEDSFKRWIFGVDLQITIMTTIY